MVTLDDPQFAQSRRQAWRVADHIRKEIIKQKLTPGDRLPGERQLMQQFGLARATVREGLAILEAEGFVTISPGRYGGVTVSAVPTEAVMRGMSAYLYFEKATWTDLYQARLAIEPAVASLAFDTIDDEALKAMEETIADCERGLRKEISARAHKLAEIGFHEVIAQNCSNPVLRLSALHIIRVMQEMVVPLLVMDTDEAGRRIISDHQKILDSFVSGTKSDVVELIRLHIVDTESELMGLLQAQHQLHE